jgi:hypothetical protein
MRAWHNIENKADANVPEIFALATRDATPITSVEAALALVFATNYLDLVDIGAMRFALEKLLPYLVPANAHRVFAQLVPAYFSYFLSICVETEGRVTATFDALCSGFVGILTEKPVPRQGHVAEIKSFLKYDGPHTPEMDTQVRVADRVLDLLEAANDDAAFYIVAKCAVKRRRYLGPGEFGYLLSSRYSPKFIQCMIDYSCYPVAGSKYGGDHNPIEVFIAGLFSQLPDKNTHPAFRGNVSSSISLAKLYIRKCAGHMFFQYLIWHTLPQFAETMEHLFLWTIENCPDKLSYARAIQLIIKEDFTPLDPNGEPNVKYARRLHLLKTLVASM